MASERKSEPDSVEWKGPQRNMDTCLKEYNAIVVEIHGGGDERSSRRAKQIYARFIHGFNGDI
ncbi:hypothetical protein RRF57_009655 [Xylaria bambusicola]|uniref:Uncharacterized protein n=1 Tax=Xylaria bambusicola TaxID=326684 RepID=A0AAN7UX56_9PEZI